LPASPIVDRQINLGDLSQEAMMHEASGIASSSSRATALFEGGVLSFTLPGGATFEDLVDRLAELAARASGRAIAINIKFEAPGYQLRPAPIE